MRASILCPRAALMATCLAACSSVPVERRRVEFESLAESGLSVASFDDSVQVDLSAGSADSPPRGRFRFLGLEHEVVASPGTADTPPYAVVDPGTSDEVRVEGAIRERVIPTWTGPHGETQFAEIAGTVSLRAAAGTDARIGAEVEASGTIGEIKYVRFSVAPLLGSVSLGGVRRRFLIFAHDPSRPDALDPGRLTWAFDRDDSGEIDATPDSGDVFRASDRVAAFPGAEVRLASVAPDFRSCEVEVRASTDEGPSMLAVGALAPPIDEATLDGGRFRLADHLGSRVLLVFWASWCGPCRRELAELVARRRDADLRYLWIETVSIDDHPEQAKLFASDVKLPWPVVMSPAGRKNTVRKRYHVAAVPDAVLIDEDGRVVARHVLMKDMKDLLSRASK